MSDTAMRRGRPKGSGIDDSARLAAIAHLLATNPEMKPTTAIKSLGVSDPSIIRRLRDKYAEVSQSLAAELVNAEQEAARAEEAVSAPPATAAPAGPVAVKRSKRARAAAAEARTTSRRVAEPASKPVDAAQLAAAPAPASTTAFDRTNKSASSTTARPSAARSSRSKSASVKKTADALPAPISTEPPAVIEAHDAGTSTARSETTNATAAVSTAPASVPAPEPATTTLDRPATPRLPVADDLFVSMFGLGVAATTSALAAQLKFANHLARTPYVTLALRQQLALNEWALRLVASARPARRNAG